MSLWGKYTDDFHFRSLEEKRDVDTLIIGGGICGLTTLYYLQNQSSIMLVDASQICEGVTKNTTGKITFLQETIYTDLTKNINEKTAIFYLNSQKYAMSLIKEIILKEKIDCDLEKVNSFLFTNEEKNISKIKEEKAFLERQNISVYEEEIPLKNFSKYAIKVEDTFVFNPIKYLNGLKKILRNKEIYENTKIKNITYKKGKYYCDTGLHVIIAKNVIVACHYPFFVFPFLLPLKSHIEKSYLLACKTDKNYLASGINVDRLKISFRYYEDEKEKYIIYLSGMHPTCFKQNDQKNFIDMQKMFSIPDDKILFKWSNVDIFSSDSLPLIGKIKQGLYIASAFNAWGITNSILSAKILSDSIQGIVNPYQNLFQLKRINFYRFENFFFNFFSNLYAFSKSIHLKKNWYSKNLTFQNINGKRIAIYKDHNGVEHKVHPICPHLKCGLVFNELEKTWDCPCHSSRFSIDGKCIKGPSVYDISYKE